MNTKLVFSISLFVLSITSLTAQQEYFEYGFKGGINIANVSGNQTSNYDNKTSMNIGGYGLYKILPKLGIQAELLYSEQGFSNEFQQNDVNPIEINQILKIQYINLPVLASYNVIENLWIEGGMQFGYLINAEEEREESFIDDSQQLVSRTENIDQTDVYEDFDVGLAAGLRYKLNRNFMLQARYTKSTNDINKNLSGEQFNEVWSFSVGFVF